jgi:hypothetical protein
MEGLKIVKYSTSLNKEYRTSNSEVYVNKLNDRGCIECLFQVQFYNLYFHYRFLLRFLTSVFSIRYSNCPYFVPVLVVSGMAGIDVLYSGLKTGMPIRR